MLVKVCTKWRTGKRTKTKISVEKNGVKKGGPFITEQKRDPMKKNPRNYGAAEKWLFRIRAPHKWKKTRRANLELVYEWSNRPSCLAGPTGSTRRVCGWGSATELLLKKSHIKIVSSWLLLTIWNSSNCSRKTRPVCSCETDKKIKKENWTGLDGLEFKCRWIRIDTLLDMAKKKSEQNRQMNE